ncbi:hypothetical protein [Cellulophaga sp. Hel_I_12]|uniref:hypothetical protein n=1 Tax=Cellulophaga sp. Hel_I_12 TaxID=1249972 RepID=UPI00064867AB|nr:hypothetical protein [Cellulophaga sp. Hel_I_12]
MKIKMFFPNFLLVLFIASFALSCSNDDQKDVEPTISADEIARINELVAADLMVQFKVADPSYSKEVKFTSTAVEIIDGEYFLVSTSSELKTTTLLKVVETTQENKLALSLVDAGVSCTSKVCISGLGCTPNSSNLSCRECPGGDCARTITLDVDL